MWGIGTLWPNAIIRLLGVGVIVVGCLTTAEAQTISAREYGSVVVCEYDTESPRAVCWIGCSVLIKDGSEYDLPPQKVRGRGSVSFVIPSRLQGEAESYAVAMWRKIVDNCGCRYCRKNGYHLEDRLDYSKGKLQRRTSAKKVRFERTGKDISVYWGGRLLFKQQRDVRIRGENTQDAQQSACNAIEGLLGITAALAGLPGTGAAPPICKITAVNDTGRTVGSVQLDPLSSEGFYYGLRASGVGGQLLAYGLLDMGFVKLSDDEYVYYY